jgi:hypothetical protein
VLMSQRFTSPRARVESHRAWRRRRCRRAAWCHDRGRDATCGVTVAIVAPCGVVAAVTVVVLVVVVAVVTPCGVATVVAVVAPRDWSAKEGVSRRRKKRTYEQTVACEVKSSPSPPSYTMRMKQARPTTLRSCTCNPHSMPTTLRRPTLRDTKQKRQAGPCCVLSERVTSRRGTRAMAEPSVLRERHIALEVIRVGPGGP